ncbi:hypothetical protein [Persicitalea jodogahamensis]|uniref:hypothetical protein n=1 Tax=Persicitalea jodogahamensis TaxID=402147 RepID=UPI0016741919|nr:hypothetical protein [Persicitalea jodogahamensis]
MKKKLLMFMLGIGLFFAMSNSHGQSSPTVPADTPFVLPLAGDTLPTIAMEVDGQFILSGAYTPWWIVISGYAFLSGWGREPTLSQFY